MISARLKQERPAMSTINTRDNARRSRRLGIYSAIGMGDTGRRRAAWPLCRQIESNSAASRLHSLMSIARPLAAILIFSPRRHTARHSAVAGGRKSLPTTEIFFLLAIAPGAAFHEIPRPPNAAVDRPPRYRLYPQREKSMKISTSAYRLSASLSRRRDIFHQEAIARQARPCARCRRRGRPHDDYDIDVRGGERICLSQDKLGAWRAQRSLIIRYYARLPADIFEAMASTLLLPRSPE